MSGILRLEMAWLFIYGLFCATLWEWFWSGRLIVLRRKKKEGPLPMGLAFEVDS
jgi:hypothetical protein